MKMLRHQLRGVTMAETMVTCAVVSVVLAVVVGGMFALQRSFAASQSFTDAHLEQVRALDEMKRDARAAAAVSVQSGGTVLALTIPTNAPNLLSFQFPASVLGMLSSTPPTPANKTVTYALAAQRLTRTESLDVRVVATRQTTFHAEAMEGDQFQATVAFPSAFSGQHTETPASTMSTGLIYRAGNH